ncbi:hypothetical protein [Brockia lithotrophica]|uniref:Type IV pilus assembly protein PilM n=1 Tax=Brockia lithotrophica TaxID=933949 RepID=A0A660L5Y2_9BACL|nr:hypothetical protein [Brockia lithotrophica]RKQ88624.1 hypothetical protein C7438_0263 [Brockia lithotrophica]
MLSVLALEVAERKVRAAVVRWSPTGMRVDVCTSLDREGAAGPFPEGEELSSVLRRLPFRPRKVVLVSPAVTTVEVSVDRVRLRRLRGAQLREVLRWEAEPFLPAPPTDYFLGYARGPESEDGRVVFWVSALLRDEYAALRTAFAERGLKLGKVFAPEFCFPVGGALGFRGRKFRDLLVAEVGEDAVRFARFRKGQVYALYVPPPEIAAPLLTFLAASAGSSEVSLEVGGTGSSFPLPSDVAAPLREALAIRGMLGLPVALVGSSDLRREGGSRTAALLAQLLGAEGVYVPAWVREGCGAEFAAAVGGGVRQLSLRGADRAIGVDDLEERVARMRERIQLYPLLATLAVGLIFGAHYLVVREQLARVQAEIQSLEEKKQEIDAAQARLQELKKEAETLRKKVQAVEAQTAFLQETYRTEEERIHRLLKVVAEDPEIFVDKVSKVPPPPVTQKDKKPASSPTVDKDKNTAPSPSTDKDKNTASPPATEKDKKESSPPTTEKDKTVPAQKKQQVPQDPYPPVDPSEAEKAYRVGGWSLTLEGIHRLLLRYQMQPWCQYVRLDLMKSDKVRVPREGPTEEGRAPVFEERPAYTFVLTVVFKE